MPAIAQTTGAVQPAMTPSPGIVSNFDNPHSQARSIYVICSICLGLVAPLIILRVYTRARIAKFLWWDDLVSVLSSVCLTLRCLWLLPLRAVQRNHDSKARIFLVTFVKCMFLMIDHGGSVDIWDVPKTEYLKFTKINMAIARLTVTLAKLAILIPPLRLFEPRKTGHMQLWFWLWFMIFFNILYCTIHMLVVQLQCIHRKEKADGSCVDEHLLLMAASIINIITEVALLIVLILVVRVLHIPRGNKIGIIGVLSFGAGGIALAFARLVWQSFTPNRNPTVYNMTVLRLAIGETTIAIMTGCLLVIPAFYEFHIQRHSNDVNTYTTPTIEPATSQETSKSQGNLSISVTTELVVSGVQLEDLRRN